MKKPYTRRGNFGEKNGFWKGGRTVTSSGYVLIRVGTDHHLADVRGYAYEHRLVAERKIGRRLVSGEEVHHINGNRMDNRPENLQVAESTASHRLLHRTVGFDRRLPGEENVKIECACGCGEIFDKYDSSGRPRKYVSGHNPQISPTADKIIAMLSAGPMPRKEMIGSFTNKEALATALSKLKKIGVVENISHGVWQLVNAEREVVLRED